MRHNLPGLLLFIPFWGVLAFAVARLSPGSSAASCVAAGFLFAVPLSLPLAFLAGVAARLFIR
jgi:glycopeptide antibiotics resistance protein